MPVKETVAKRVPEHAIQEFRQFAWNLASTLAQRNKPVRRGSRKPAARAGKAAPGR